ncbi:NPCBM/NEW2 domain-containing protein [Terrisporobacter sp.]
MKKTLSKVLAVSIIATNISPAVNVFADEVLKEKTSIVEKNVVNKAKVTPFNLKDFSNFEQYNTRFRVSRESIKSISNNGGQYASSAISRAIDGNLSTHWETGTPNSDTFKNQVVFEFNEIQSIDRIAYLTRQDSAKGKGYPIQFEIYSSITGNDEDMKLVCTGEHSSTGNMMQFKFDTINTKKIKFVFKEANNYWASASEFWFYKEDKIIDKMDRLFTNSSMNQVSEEFNTEEKINALEEEVKSHPLYENFKEEIEDARTLINRNQVEYSKATTQSFKNYDNEEYSKLFKMPLSNIKSIKNNGGHYSSQVIENAVDGKLDTYWETNRYNNGSFYNEVEVEFKEPVTLNRVVYGARKSDLKGFAQEFEIYASKTSKGDTYELVSSGTYNKSQGLVEAKFNLTEFKRLKFKFKKSDQNWATLNELSFYTEDKLADKISRLFTNSSMNQVSEEFNTEEKINALEEEVKSHPLYENFKEDIENAKTLINKNQVEYSKAVTQSFKNYDNEEYSKLFKMPLSNIKSIKNNGGHYSSQVIENAVDGKLDTYWETNRYNNGSFYNEVEVEFKESVTLNRVVYGARKSDLKGFAQEFEIYVSKTSKGDTYELVSSGTYNKSQGLVEAKFNPTEFKRLKFKFKKSDQNWATLNELSFYTEDKLADKLPTLFTDGTMSKVSEEFNSLEKINTFEEQAKKHPLYNEFKEDIDLAKDLISNPQKEDILELERRGDSINQSVKKKVWRFQDWQVTGYRAKPGDKITVYVDVKDGEPTPTLIYKQILNQHGGSTTFSLKKGKNVITIPQYNVDADKIPEGTALGGGLYFTNYASDKQSKAPRVRIVGAQKYPVYKLGETDDDAIMKELEEYVKKVKANPSSVPDMFDVSSNKTISLVTATKALQWYKDNNKTPRYTAEKWDESLDLTMKFWGFDNSSDLNSDYNFRILVMTKNILGGAFMNAGGGVIGIRPGNQDLILGVDRGWGTIHELGHNFDTSGRTIVEVTNNILPLYFGSLTGNTKITDQNIWENNIYPKVGLDDYSENILYDHSDSTNLSQLAPLWQLQLYDKTFYPKFEQQFRAKDFGNRTREDIYRSWVKAASYALKLDLSEFFARHGIRVSDEVKQELSKYPKPDKKIQYLNDSVLRYEGNGFTSNAKVKVNKNISGQNLKLLFDIDEENKNNVLGYEIHRDGKYIGFTSKSSFIDKNVNLDENHDYIITPYDKKLNTLKNIKLNSLDSFIVSNPVVTVVLNGNLDEKSYVLAKDSKGNDITKDVKVKYNNVDMTRNGEYEIVYSILNPNGSENTSKTEVKVVSQIDYLSDLAPKSVKNGWGTMRKDKSIDNDTIGLTRKGGIVTYAKGLGVHAPSEMVYDLEDNNYEYFESYIGVDQFMKDSPNSSIVFKVLVDGQEKYNSGLMRSGDEQKYVKVDIKNVKELKLIVTDGENGNAADHADWADAKIIIKNAKPRLTIPKSISTKVGEEIDLNQTYSAIDAEDGDITSNVKVSGKVDFERAGKYPITYTVTDSDGNEISKTRTISVVNMDDYKYLTDFNWKSIQYSYRVANKDKAISENPLRLTGEDNQEVTYQRGIGAHSTSTIIYDLSDKDYSYFTSYVGVDRRMFGTIGSVTFEVYVDGVKKFDSGLMNSRDKQKFVEVDITGAKELKLVVTDGGNGNGSDHATWGDTKLYFANEEN